MANFTLTKNANTQNGVSGNGLTVSVYDSGSIVTIPQPGGSAVKLTDGTQQSATTATCDSTLPGDGNSIRGVASVLTSGGINSNGQNQVPTYGPSGCAPGYSVLGE